MFCWSEIASLDGLYPFFLLYFTGRKIEHMHFGSVSVVSITVRDRTSVDHDSKVTAQDENIILYPLRTQHEENFQKRIFENHCEQILLSRDLTVLTMSQTMTSLAGRRP
jgi:hypothetical protein